MIRIGITGIIGSGKSTVSHMLNEEGLTVIDLDQLAKEVSHTPEVKEEIRKTFGDGFITEENALDVEKMRDTVFQDEKLLGKLEEIIHPRALAEMERLVALEREKGAAAVIIDIPLLIEKGLGRVVDKVVVVSADMDIIRGRLVKRGMIKEDIERRISHQIPLEEKEKAADYVVCNNGTEEDLRKEVGILLEKIKTWEVKDTCILTN